MLSGIKPLHKLLIVLGVLGIFSVFTALGSGDELGIENFSPQMILVMKLVQVIGVICIFIIPALLYSLMFTEEKVWYLGVGKKPAITSLLLSVILFVGALPFISWMEQLNKQISLPKALAFVEDWMKRSESNAEQLTNLFLSDTTISGLFLNLFVVAFMAALSEELFFRAMVQKSIFGVVKNHHVAIWMAAILFSAFHMQFYGFIPRTVMGAMLGYLFYWSGSIWIPVFAHFANNAFAVISMYYVNIGVISDSWGEVKSISDQLWMVLVSVVIVFLTATAIYSLEKKRLH